MSNQLENLRVLLGVTGGIAAFKAVALASKLRQQGAEVRTIMTKSACRLVGPKSFEAVTGGDVYTTLWSGVEEFKIGHVSLEDWADIVVVAPATANIISKVACGICDDCLSTTLCVCWKKTVLIAPAMNTNMWENPAVKRNIEKLRNMGMEIIGPAEGELACGKEGTGRMAEPEEILEVIEARAEHIRD